MLIPKNIFNIAKVASKDHFRVNICGVNLERKAGKPVATATDGHALITATWPEMEKEKYPLIEGKPDAASVKPDFQKIIGAQDFASIGKGLPNKSKFEPARCAALDEVNANGKIDATLWDISGVKSFSVQTVEAQYPDYKTIVPKDVPCLTIGFNANLLGDLLKTLASMSADSKAVLVKMEFTGPGNAVKITHTDNQGTELTAVVMPMRL